MSFNFRQGSFDVAIVAGPRIENWPTVGVKSISRLCSEAGLSVGVFGSEDLRVRGVVPLPVSGGLVFVEDVQGRIHRIEARAVVKVSAEPIFPKPFPGWNSEGLIPLSTAMKLKQQAHMQWGPCTVVLGTGNPALRFGSEILESDKTGLTEVYCVEMVEPGNRKPGEKAVSGWEVERRRFEISGGKIIFAEPVQLKPKSPLVWELRLKDERGVRLLEVGRVVSAGPFFDTAGIREYPLESNLFELEQTALKLPQESIEGWVMEQERGITLAGRIIRSLVSEISNVDLKEKIDRLHRRARSRLKRYQIHQTESFEPKYQGKWMDPLDAKRLRTFEGTPKEKQKEKLTASVECIEAIPCNLCQQACPEGALELGHVPRKNDRILIESKCTGCGLCLTACPSSVPVLLEEKPDRPTQSMVLPWRKRRLWKKGEFATLLNRQGDPLGSTRILEVMHEDAEIQWVRVDVPTHLLWEARGIRRVRSAAAEDLNYLENSSALGDWPAWMQERVEVMWNGERRFVRDQVPASAAFFENGQARPEDVLFCSDGSCGRCEILVNGVKRKACTTYLHKGISIQTQEESVTSQLALPMSLSDSGATDTEPYLCPCAKLTVKDVRDGIVNGKIRSTDAAVSMTHIGSGKCHGQLCMGAMRRVVSELGIDSRDWIDWRFPWMDWELGG